MQRAPSTACDADAPATPRGAGRPSALRGLAYGTCAAAAFGASVPACKLWGVPDAPLLNAGILYVGSGAGLALVFLLRRVVQGTFGAGIAKGDWPLLALSIAIGGAVAPSALMWGLLRVSASTGSLLGNLELVFTALLACLFFREKIRRLAWGGLALVAIGGVLVALAGANSSDVSAAAGASPWSGLCAVALAYFAWSLDNNLTRKLSANDPLVVAGLRGWLAGGALLATAMMVQGHPLPAPSHTALLLAVGAVGYGGSLTCLVLAMRSLGAARAGAVFGLAPFFGALLAAVWLGEPFPAILAAAAGCMAAGVGVLAWESTQGK